MKSGSFKNARIVRSSWLEESGRRLDCKPYMSGALAAREILKGLLVKKEPLKSLTAGHAGGIYTGPIFRRNYVQSTDHGVPFITSGNMVQSDLSNLPLLRKKDAESFRLSHLKLEKGTILIACSGTVGRISYVRPDMAGMWSAQDVMKVVPDESHIASGYLYAFLSGQFGVPLVVSGTHGAIIQRIAPEHIANLPVPRLGRVEQTAHELIARGAAAIAQYSMLIAQARNKILLGIGLQDPAELEWFSGKERIGWRENGVSPESLRAYNYDPRVKCYFAQLNRIPNEPLGALCDPVCLTGHIAFKRIKSDPEHGFKLIGQREAFQMHPEGRWISRRSVAGLGLVVPPKTVLIASHGTLGEAELYCRAVYVTERTSSFAYSGDFCRCIPLPGKIRGGYLYAFLSTGVGFRLLRSMSTGAKQQSPHPAMLARLPIPRLGEQLENEIADLVDEAAKQYDLGLGWEDAARRVVENAIRGGR